MNIYFLNCNKYFLTFDQQNEFHAERKILCGEVSFQCGWLMFFPPSHKSYGVQICKYVYIMFQILCISSSYNTLLTYDEIYIYSFINSQLSELFTCSKVSYGCYEKRTGFTQWHGLSILETIPVKVMKIISSPLRKHTYLNVKKISPPKN